jgi:phosphatidylglycerol---prolipoprotein diacylglyceryl transferase
VTSQSAYFVFPEIDPVAFSLGPLDVRWYALAYIAGILAAWRYVLYLTRLPPALVSPAQVEDMVTWGTLGVIVGGRLGQVLLWNPAYYFAHPLDILKVWEGGMAFHGGLVGVAIAICLYARRAGIPILALSDPIAAAVPIGLGLGRIANFVNGELWGRVTDVSWAVVFPRVDENPRHPSQLYEALGEGLLLFAVLYLLTRRENLRRRPGLVTGVFLVGYALARMIVEQFREPEALTGALGATTWGQWLSLPMLAFGCYFVWRAFRRPTA